MAAVGQHGPGHVGVGQSLPAAHILAIAPQCRLQSLQKLQHRYEYIAESNQMSTVQVPVQHKESRFQARLSRTEDVS
jgi:hypothetical protein